MDLFPYLGDERLDESSVGSSTPDFGRQSDEPAFSMHLSPSSSLSYASSSVISVAEKHLRVKRARVEEWSATGVPGLGPRMLPPVGS